MNQQDKATSKFLSLVLRHKPEEIGLSLNEEGWAQVDELLESMREKGFNLSFGDLKHLVDTNDKKRFAFSGDQKMIRAAQGHSLSLNIKFNQATPPQVLYHGTAERNIPSIMQKGLIKGERHHVHLSSNPETAKSVGGRYGKPVVLIVDAKSMARDGHIFYLSENGVWLTEAAPAQYLTLQNEEAGS